jgi:CBS domain-containing protein
MTRTVVSLVPDALVSEAAKRLARGNISAAPVVEGEAVIGILSESDILQALAPAAPGQQRRSVLESLAAAWRMGAAGDHRPEPVTVRDAMSPAVECIRPEASMWEAAALMQRRSIKRLPVIDDNGALLGIVSRADLIRAMARTDESIQADVVHSLQELGDSSRSIDVEVEEGTVTLTGIAPDATTIAAAEQLARRVAGVSQLSNDVQRERAVDLAIDEEAFRVGPGGRR